MLVSQNGYRSHQSKRLHTALCGAAFAAKSSEFNEWVSKIMGFFSDSEQIDNPKFILEIPGYSTVVGKTGNHSTHIHDAIALPFRDKGNQNYNVLKAYTLLRIVTDFIKKRMAAGKITADEYMEVAAEENDYGFNPFIEAVITKNMMALELLAKDFRGLAPERYKKVLTFSSNGFGPLREAVMGADEEVMKFVAGELRTQLSPQAYLDHLCGADKYDRNLFHIMVKNKTEDQKPNPFVINFILDQIYDVYGLKEKRRATEVINKLLNDRDDKGQTPIPEGKGASTKPEWIKRLLDLTFTDGSREPHIFDRHRKPYTIRIEERNSEKVQVKEDTYDSQGRSLSGRKNKSRLDPNTPATRFDRD